MTPHEICIHEDRWSHQTDIIQEIRADNKRFEEKLDKILKELHEFKLESAKDDFNIDNRVTALENTVKVIKWLIGLLFGTGIIWIIITTH